MVVLSLLMAAAMQSPVLPALSDQDNSRSSQTPTQKIMVRTIRSPVISSQDRTATVYVAKREDPSSNQTTSETMISPQLPVGLRLDAQGGVVPHSFLGSARDLEELGLSRPTSANNSKPQPREEASRRPSFDTDPSYKNILAGIPRWTKKAQQYEDQRQQRQLENWKKSNEKRVETEDNLVRRLSPRKSLMMQTSAEVHRRIKEEQDMVDTVLSDKAALPFDEPGKNSQGGTDFWSQGEETTKGLRLTLKKQRVPDARNFEYIGKPDHVRSLNDTGPLDLTRSGLERKSSFFASNYLITETPRQQMVQTTKNMLFPHVPDLGGLEIIGTHIPKSEGEEQFVTEAIFSEEDTQSASTEAKHTSDPPTAIEAISENILQGPHLKCVGSVNCPPDSRESRVVFNSPVSEKSESKLTLTNTGSTALFVSWEKVDLPNTLGTSRSHSQRFFFDLKPRSILPGETHTVPVFFIANKAGVYMERWRLIVRPELMQVQEITLSATATAPDANRSSRESLENRLEKEIIESSVKRLIMTLVDRVHPVKQDLPAAKPRLCDIFTAANKELCIEHGLKFDHEAVSKMKSMYTTVECQRWAQINAPGQAEDDLPPPDAKGKKAPDPKSKSAEETEPLPDMPRPKDWDYSISTLKSAILQLDHILPRVYEAYDWKQQDVFLGNLSAIVTSLSSARDPWKVERPLPDSRDVCESVVARIVDAVSNSCSMGRSIMKLPEMPLVIAPEVAPEVYVPKPISAPVKGAKKAPAKGGKDDKKKGGAKPGNTEEPLPPLEEHEAERLFTLQYPLARAAVVAGIDELASILDHYSS